MVFAKVLLLEQQYKESEHEKAGWIRKCEHLEKKRKEQVERWSKKCDNLRSSVQDCNNMVRENEKKVVQHSIWGKKREAETANLQEIINNQQKEKEEAMKKTVIQVIKEKEELVRHTVEKKNCHGIWGWRRKDTNETGMRKGESCGG